MLAIFAIVPFLMAAVVAALIRKEKVAGPVALAAGIASIAMVAWLYLNNPGPQALSWFSVGGFAFSITTSLSQIHMLFLALIAVMSTLVILYSIDFMDVPSEKRPYYLEISLFVAGMMLFAIGADLITLFIGWELVGLTSYLLIGFWRHKQSAIDAGKKAALVLFIGDILVFAGIALLWSQLHSLSLQYVIANASGYWAAVAALLIVIGALTKSAQFPFHEWLTDAMEGPTPVSALLHSSTMVKAGVFLLAILLPLLLKLGMGPILIGVGVASVVLASINAMASTHIKRILAYSTIEDMGLMLIALGFGSIVAAVMLFIFQTFYKGLVFMNAGVVMKANKERDDIRKIAGSKRLSILVPTIIAVASLAGVFPLGGFFGKIAVESAVSNYAVYAILLAAELVSSMYIFRWLFTPLSKDKSKIKTDYKMPISMTAAIYLLVLALLASSAAWIYYVYAGHTASLPPIGYQGAAIYTVIVAAGLLLSYLFYYRRLLPNPDLRSRLSRISDASIEVNAVYRLVTHLVSAGGTAIDVVDYNLYGIVKGSGYGLGKISAVLGDSESG